jgi:hypothetical protein
MRTQAALPDLLGSKGFYLHASINSRRLSHSAAIYRITG